MKCPYCDSEIFTNHKRCSVCRKRIIRDSYNISKKTKLKKINNHFPIYAFIVFIITVSPILLAGFAFDRVIESEDNNWGQPFIENNPSYVSLTNTSIFYKIDTTNLPNNIKFSIEANYTLFNSDSENRTNSLISPFPSFFNNNSNCTIKINQEIIPYYYNDSIFNFGHKAYLEQSFGWGYDNYTAIVCNITLPKNDSLTINYNLESVYNFGSRYERIPDESRIGYYFFTDPNFDLVPSSVSIMFQITGAYPDYISSDRNYLKNCTILDYPTYRNYVWIWNNEIISDYDYALWLHYKFDDYYPSFFDKYIPLFLELNTALIAIPSIILITINLYIKKIKK